MSRKKTETEGAKPDSVSFETALERLETIVKEMESGALSLEHMMARFEEGQALVKLCSGKLNQVERRIEILAKEGENVVAEPFGEESGGEDEAASDKDDDNKNGMPF
jgi:exodeoxyribonuclease VII small subunit